MQTSTIAGPIFWRVIHLSEILDFIDIIPCLLRIFPCYSCRCEIWHLEQVLFHKLYHTKSMQISTLDESITQWRGLIHETRDPVTWIFHNLVNMNINKAFFSLSNYTTRESVSFPHYDIRDILDVLYLSLNSILQDRVKITPQVEEWIRENPCSWRRKCSQYALSIDVRLEAWNKCFEYLSPFLEDEKIMQIYDLVKLKDYLGALRRKMKR